MGVNDKVINAAIDLVNARFTVDERGYYFLKNSGNEEYVNSCIQTLHQALMDAGHTPMRHHRLSTGKCTCDENHN